MSDEMTESVESSPKRAPRLLVLGLLVLVGLLATITIVLIEHARLQTAVASNGQDTSTSSLGLTSQGFDTPTAGTSNAVADIAARLATNALSFAPQSFDAKVAEAKSHMTIAMQASYQRLLTAHNTRKVVVIGGVTIKTTVVHDSNDPKKQAYLGVVSLTPTQGEFLMMVQGVATVTGSTREAVTPLMLDVTVQRIGNAWLLEDIKTCQAPTRAGQTFCSAI